MQRLRSVQVLRALAACAVVAFHSYSRQFPISTAAINFGAAGVDLFFVISGFIMAQVARERTPGEFLKDRLWRIYPMWWIAVLPWLFLAHASVWRNISSLTLWPIYAGGFAVPDLSVGWTLCFEMLFYLAVTLSLATRPGLPLAAYALLMVVGMFSSSPLLHFLGSPITLEFLLGVMVAHLPRRPALGILLPLGCGLFALSQPTWGEITVALDPAKAIVRALQWGGPAALITWGAISLEDQFNRQAFDWPVLLGDASYSIYLFHSLVIYGLAAGWFPRLFVAIAFSLAVHLVVERDVIRARRRLRWPFRTTPRVDRGLDAA